MLFRANTRDLASHTILLCPALGLRPTAALPTEAAETFNIISLCWRLDTVPSTYVAFARPPFHKPWKITMNIYHAVATVGLETLRQIGNQHRRPSPYLLSLRRPVTQEIGPPQLQFRTNCAAIAPYGPLCQGQVC